MITKLVLLKNPLIWIIFHVFLGFISTFSKYPYIAWFYIVLLTSLPYISDRKEINNSITFLIVYILPFELFGRILKTSPLIPYELGKYSLFIMLLYGIFILGHFKGKTGLFMMVLLLPSLLFDWSEVRTSNDIIFNVLGSINVALAISYFYQIKITQEGFKKILTLISYPLITLLTFTFLKTPSFDEMDFSSSRNDAASGGFGPNQVSTALGFGALLMFLFVFNKWSFSGKKWLDYFLLFGFTFQGLLTFSRGGMFGTALAILVLIFLLKNTPYEEKIKYNIPNIGKFVLPAIFSIIISYQVTDYATGGWLSLRYQGETRGTLAGVKEKDFNHYTTGRADIFESDIDLWMNNFILGAGAGSSPYMREHHRGMLTHTEVSRLLAEHGVLGLGYLVCLFVVGYRVFKSKQNPLYKSILIAFFVLAVYTTFHAAMRTFITPLLIGLSTISIVDFKRKNEPRQVVSK